MNLTRAYLGQNHVSTIAGPMRISRIMAQYRRLFHSTMAIQGFSVIGRGLASGLHAFSPATAAFLGLALFASGDLSALEPNLQQSAAPAMEMPQSYKTGNSKVANLQEPNGSLPRLVEPEWIEEWKPLSASTDLRALYLYITRHPDKPAAATARERLRKLIANAGNMSELVDFVQYTPADSEENALAKRRLTAAITLEWEKIERDAWMTALDTGTPEAFRRYLNTYPFGKHAQLAKQRLISLNLAAMNKDGDASGGEDNQFLSGLDFDTSSATAAASEAEDIKAKLQARWRADDEAAWREANIRDSELGFVLYLYTHPEGKYAAKAEAKLAALKAAETRNKEHDAAWMKAQAEGTLRSYLGYLQAYPKGRYSADVLRMLKAFSRTNHEAARGHDNTYEREPLQRHSRPMQWLSEN